MPFYSRALVALVLASAFAVAARRRRSLSPSGAWAAAVVGTTAFVAGWGWSAPLLAFFFSSTMLSRWRGHAKAHLTRSVVAKGVERDAWQVMANGGVFAVAAIGSIATPSPWWSLAGLGALAAATADTWATEVGTAVGGVPRSLLGWRPVPPGTSGAISGAGTGAMLAGALFLGTVAMLTGLPSDETLPVVAGGIGGAVVDTVLGATMQERRWCPACRRSTERLLHDCGHVTEHRGGVARLNNDVVNLTSCLAGAAIALACGRWQ